MKKLFLIPAFLLFLHFSFSLVYAESEVYTEVQTKATGDNASVHTEITNIVNDKEVKVESDSPGEIRVDIKDGEIEVESNTEASPTVIISDFDEKNNKEGGKEEEIDKIKEIREEIFIFLENLFSRLRQVFSFWK